MTSRALDPRRHPYRADLAAECLRGRVDVPRYVEGELMQVVHGAAPLRSRPDALRCWASQVLHGELVKVYEHKDGWAWVQAIADEYGISRERARQIEERLKEKLKTFFQKEGVKVEDHL